MADEGDADKNALPTLIGMELDVVDIAQLLTCLDNDPPPLQALEELIQTTLEFASKVDAYASYYFGEDWADVETPDYEDSIAFVSTGKTAH